MLYNSSGIRRLYVREKRKAAARMTAASLDLSLTSIPQESDQSFDHSPDHRLLFSVACLAVSFLLLPIKSSPCSQQKKSLIFGRIFALLHLQQSKIPTSLVLEYRPSEFQQQRTPLNGQRVVA